MKITIDTTRKTLVLEQDAQRQDLPLYSPDAFGVLSRFWLKVGWDLKYSYQFTWLGRPIIQMPEDILRIQEIICRLQPDVILETGIAHGGSLLLSASLCRLMGTGRVIGVDIEIRPHNRRALEQHPLRPLLTMIEGSSIDPEIVGRVKSLIRPGEKVIVLLDSCHTRDHVLAELEAYHDLVPPGSYLVAADGIMHDLADLPAAKPDWTWNNPSEAARQFVQRHPQFAIDEPPRAFNESKLASHVTYWPSAFVKRIRD
ncbi:MAG: cephalosporin hydroxylase family protein [Verrucomicrobia bacterium]|nr:cephalosporin hydroxylase family protein [Verrucomicrobiota bacterium]